MNQDQFDAFLEDSTNLPEDSEQKELALMFKEIEDLDPPDPGQAYWNQFNSRLQQRLEQPKKSFWQMWLKPGVALLTTAVLLVILIPKPSGTQEALSLANLDDDYLLVIGEMYASDFWANTNQEIAENDLDLLLETTETLFDDPFSNTLDLDFDSELTGSNQEG